MNPVISTRSRRLLPQRARRLVGRKTGLVRNLLCYLPDRADPDVFYSTAIEPDLDVMLEGGVGSLEAGGTAVDITGSLMSSIGETAERYSLYHPDPTEFVYGSYQELVDTKINVVDYPYLWPFDDEKAEEVGLTPLRRETPLHWQPMTNLLSGDEWYVPAQWVWMGIVEPLGEDWYYPTTSNGCACGNSVVHSVVGGLSEYLERDAIMRTWYRQLPTTPLDISKYPTIQELVDSRFETDYLSVHYFEVPSGISVPAIGCGLVDSRNRAPKFVIGGSHGLNTTRILMDALVEVAQSWTYLKDLVVQKNDGTIEASAIYNLQDNLLFYSQPEQFQYIKPLLGEGPPQPPTKPPISTNGYDEVFQSYLKLANQANLTPLALELTPPDIRSVGFTVTRVIIPELLGLSLPSLPPINHPALKPHEITRLPHPYP